jgi:Protein of unknown function (DUF3306)
MSSGDFFKRWSRRKREATADNRPRQELPADEAERARAVPVADENAAEPELDLSLLPPIESITSATDVTAFLRKGIPQELTRAALRRAWTADPVIRDFVGLAENAWDFNDPNAMPGFGPLDCSEAELQVLVDRIVGGLSKVVEKPPQESAESALEHAAVPQQNSIEADAEPRTTDQLALAELSPGRAAPQPQVASETDCENATVRHRTHGGALPR